MDARLAILLVAIAACRPRPSRSSCSAGSTRALAGMAQHRRADGGPRLPRHFPRRAPRRHPLRCTKACGPGLRPRPHAHRPRPDARLRTRRAAGPDDRGHPHRVQTALDAGLKVVVDLHPIGRGDDIGGVRTTLSATAGRTMSRLLAALPRRLNGLPADRVALELLNEPPFDCDAVYSGAPPAGPPCRPRPMPPPAPGARPDLS
jgi:hypothetical protein